MLSPFLFLSSLPFLKNSLLTHHPSTTIHTIPTILKKITFNPPPIHCILLSLISLLSPYIRKVFDLSSSEKSRLREELDGVKDHYTGAIITLGDKPQVDHVLEVQLLSYCLTMGAFKAGLPEVLTTCEFCDYILQGLGGKMKEDYVLQPDLFKVIKQRTNMALGVITKEFIANLGKDPKAHIFSPITVEEAIQNKAYTAATVREVMCDKFTDNVKKAWAAAAQAFVKLWDIFMFPRIGTMLKEERLVFAVFHVGVSLLADVVSEFTGIKVVIPSTLNPVMEWTKAFA